jgi:hypothetical protein
MRNWLLLLTLLAVGLAGVGCRKDKGPKPTDLIPPLKSRMSVEAAMHKLKASQWTTIEDQHPVVVGGRYAWRSQVLSVGEREFYGQSGELRLTFFNDRLVSTQFYPRDLDSALAAVNAADKTDVGKGGDALLSISTRVWQGRDNMDRDYIGWVDKILQAERDQALQ